MTKEPKKKVAVVTTATADIPNFRLDMIYALQKQGCEVLVLGNEPEAKWHQYFEEKNIRYRSFFVSRTGTNPISDLKTLKNLKQIFLEESPDLIFTNNVKANIYGCMAAHKTGVPAIYVMIGGLGFAFHSSSLKARLLAKIVAWEYRHSLRYATSVFLQNDEDADYFEHARIISRSQVTMVHGSGVNINTFQFSLLEYPNIQQGEKLKFVFVGRLIKDKGIREYLQASHLLFEQGLPIVSYVVGDFDSNDKSMSEKDLAPYIQEGSVVWVGYQKDVRPYLQQSHVFVLPSYHEGTPKAALEAMAVGRAIVTCDTVGCREVVIPGSNGFMVPVKNPAKLANAMKRFLDDPELASRMGTSSRTIAEDVFDVDDINAVILSRMGFDMGIDALA